MRELESEWGAGRWSKWKIGHLWVTIPSLLTERPFISLSVWLIDQPCWGAHTPLYWEQQLTLHTSAEMLRWCAPNGHKQVTHFWRAYCDRGDVCRLFITLWVFFPPSSPLLCGPYLVKFVSTSRFWPSGHRDRLQKSKSFTEKNNLREATSGGY